MQNNVFMSSSNTSYIWLFAFQVSLLIELTDILVYLAFFLTYSIPSSTYQSLENIFLSSTHTAARTVLLTELSELSGSIFVPLADEMISKWYQMRYNSHDRGRERKWEYGFLRLIVRPLRRSFKIDYNCGLILR